MNKKDLHTYRAVSKAGRFIVLIILVLQLQGQSEAMIAAGDFFTMAVDNEGTLLTWGHVNDDPFVQDTEENMSRPSAVKDLEGNRITGIQDITVGNHHALILKTDGTVLAWGDNQYGQLGNKTARNQSHPVLVRDASGNPLTDISAITAGHSHSIALRENGTLLAWGNNRRGQLGDGTTSNKLTPVHVRYADGTPVDQVVDVTAGWSHTVALLSDGTLLAWGSNQYGQLSNGTKNDQNYPIVVRDVNENPVSGIVKISAGAAHTIALSNNSTLIAWGDNREGQLGDGTTTIRLTPVHIKDAGNFIIDIAAGYYHSVARRADGVLLAWGCNKHGQLSDWTTKNRLKPVIVKNVSGKPLNWVLSITAGSSHTVAIGRDGELLSWGDNRYGQLGHKTKNQESHFPVVVMETFSTVTIKYYEGLRSKLKFSEF